MKNCVAEPEAIKHDNVLEPSSPAEEGAMKGADRRRFKADLLAIAAGADTGQDSSSPAEREEPPLSSKERRRQKAGVTRQHLCPLGDTVL